MLPYHLSILPRNVGLSPHYTALQHRRLHSAVTAVRTSNPVVLGLFRSFPTKDSSGSLQNADELGEPAARDNWI
jgi:hypothetical protein